MAKQILVLDDDPLDANLTQLTLSLAGLAVVYAQSIVEGELCATRLLDPLQPAPEPLLVLLDLKMPDPVHPQLEGSVLAAALRRRMALGHLRPAHLVALTNDYTAEREETALYAGCERVLVKPLQDNDAAWLASLLDQPVTMEQTTERAALLYQQQAEQMLSMIRRSQRPAQWQPEHMQLLLAAATLYVPPEAPDPARQAALILAVGGIAPLKAWLTQLTALLPDPHHSILRGLLAGSTPQSLHRSLAYDRSTIFRALQTLPERLSQYAVALPPIA